MFIKGIFKNSGGLIQFILFIGIVILGSVIGGIASMFLILLKSGFNAGVMTEIMSNLTDYPVYLRQLQFLSQLGTFVFPALLASYLFSENYKEYLYLNTPFNGSIVFWTILSMIFVLPFLNLITQLNEQMVLPDFLKGLEEFLKSMEESAAKLTESMLHAENIQAILFNILVVAVFAAIGEEFVFRGVLQRIFGRMIRNNHIVIWSVAFIFSAIHFQFFGFVPRLLLGAYFGYLLYFTKNLWIPILAHFTNNFIGVMLFAIYQDDSEKMKAIDSLGNGSTWWLSVLSLLLFIWAVRQIRRRKVIES
jgi:membrane protease YdiL (CAAX protease family)